MHFQFAYPSGFLKYYIKHYCCMEFSASDGQVRERVIPDENIQLMFHYKKPFAVCQSEDVLLMQPRSIISGLSGTYSDVCTQGESGVIFVSFYPAGACHFFDFPLYEIRDKSLDMQEVFGREIRDTEELLQQGTSLNERVMIIEEFLKKRYSPVESYNSQVVNSGIDIIRRQGGQISSAELAGKLSLTTKSLERKFSQYVGQTPKQYIKLIRFNAVLSNLQKANLTHNAYLNGYFDQSHFIRDFKMFSGYTPREFLKKYPDFHSGI